MHGADAWPVIMCSRSMALCAAIFVNSVIDDPSSHEYSSGAARRIVATVREFGDEDYLHLPIIYGAIIPNLTLSIFVLTPIDFLSSYVG